MRLGVMMLGMMIKGEENDYVEIDDVENDIER